MLSLFRGMGLHVSHFRGTSVDRGAAHNYHDDLMPITGELHRLALRVGQAGSAEWLTNGVSTRFLDYCSLDCFPKKII